MKLSYTGYARQYSTLHIREFAVAICRKNLQQEFAVGICLMNCRGYFPVVFFVPVFVSKYFLYMLANLVYMEAKLFYM